MGGNDNMERSSFVFYKTWWEAIKNLPRDVQGDVLTAIVEYGLNGETTEQLKPITKALLELVKPQIDANNQRFINGSKGGRKNQVETEPEPNPNQDVTKPEPNPNQTETETGAIMSNEIMRNNNIISPDGECEEQAPEGNSSLPTSESIPYRKICDMWNDTADKVPGVPKVAKLTDARKRKIAQRIREMGEKDIGKAMETYAAVLDKIPQSQFFTEKWQPDFDWLFANGSNWVKVLEGNYAKYGKPQRQNPPREPTKPIKIITSINDF